MEERMNTMNRARFAKMGGGAGKLLRVGTVCAAMCIGMAAIGQTGSGTGTGTGTGTGSGSGSGSGAQMPASGAERAGREQNNMARADTAFMKQAAENNHAEIESSRLALQKATDPAVKAFAQHMVDDHGKTGKELASLAASKGVQLPDGPSLMQKAKLKLLEAADGANFDRRYSETMGLAAHRDTIALFQKASTGARDPDIKAFATKTLPALRQHLEMAQKLPAQKQSGSADGARR